MTTYENNYIEKVYLVIKPLTGEFMAKNILKAQLNQLGINQNSLKASDLPKLAEGIKKGLASFIGADAANQISAKIKSIS